MAEYTINDVRGITHRRKRTIKISGLLSALLMLSLVFYAKPEPVYEAEVSLKIEKVTTVGDILLGTVRSGDHIATASVMISSFPVLRVVAQKAGLVPADLQPDEILRSSEYMAIIKDLEKAITATADRAGSNILIVKMQHNKPAMAKKLAELVAASYREAAYYERNQSVISEIKIVEDQAAKSRDQLTASREKLNEFRKSLELTTVTDEQHVILARYVERKNIIDNLGFKIARINDSLTTMRQAVNPEEDTRWVFTAGGTNTDSGSIQGSLNAALNDLRIKEKGLLHHYTPNHPEVLAIREAKNAIINQFIVDLEAEKKRYADEIKAVEKDLLETYAKLKGIPDAAKTYDLLSREVEANETLYNKILMKQQEVEVRKAELVEDVTIARYPVLPQVPITRIAFIGNLVVSLILSVIIGFIAGFIHEALDTVPRKLDVLAETFGVPIMTALTMWNRSEGLELVRDRYPGLHVDDALRYLSLPAHFLADSSLAEEYRAMVPNLLLTARENDIRTLAVMSATKGEGVTTCAANLAIALAQAGRSVALLDADFQAPKLHSMFGIDRQPGLSDVIMGSEDWDISIRRITDLMLGEIPARHLLAPSGLDNLYILTGGSKVENPANFINSQRMKDLISSLRDFFDFVIIDTSAILETSETSILAEKVDAALLLTEYEKLDRGTLVRFRSHLESLRVKVAGLVINKHKITTHQIEQEKLHKDTLIRFKYYLENLRGKLVGLTANKRKKNLS
ncbi:MAG: hypothetical protein A2511_01985 [Deltaproteobacteria bacterium RIFOXYD12_FULL_50_9]|nr:MAG: hypothetical protein A2511_01985 [Deltaproteobacteria bacterium RIFOXYD12_FULL_50_9]